MKPLSIIGYHLIGLLFLLIFSACSATRTPDLPDPRGAGQQVTLGAGQTQVSADLATASVPPVETGQTEPPSPRPASTPTPTPVPTPTPIELSPTPELVADRVLTSTSPDGLWKAEALLGFPSNPEALFEATGQGMDYARLTLSRVDGSEQWTPYEEWSATGLGDSFISDFYWSADGRYLFFTHNGNADGCGTPFVTDLRRVDLDDGSVSEIPLTDLGLDVITLSPDANRLAYRIAEGILIVDLESGETRTIPHEWPEGFDHLVGGYAWSPDGAQLAFIVIEDFCEPPDNSRTSIWEIEFETGEVKTLTEQDYGGMLPETDLVSMANSTLQAYLNLLFSGSSDLAAYEWAAQLYGGGYDTLVEINPDIDPEDHATLLRNACEVNGFQCLRVREVLSKESAVGEDGAHEYRFTVNLMNPDGSVFALGPCCGEKAGEPQTEFVFTVEQIDDGLFKVFELPPYMP